MESGGQAGGRQMEIDALRGVALFGVAAVNLPHFLLPVPCLYGAYLWPQSASGRAGCFAAHLLLERKSLAIFAMLFGFGCGALAASPAGTARYWRRTAGLLCLGALHALVLSPIDILLTYGSAGVLLWFCRKLPARHLAAAGVIGVLALALWKAVRLAVCRDADLGWGFAAVDPIAPAFFPRIIGDYRSGALAVVFRRHLLDLRVYEIGGMAEFPATLGYGLLGMAIQRSGLTRSPAVRRPEVAARCLAVGLAGAFGGAWLGAHCDPFSDTPAAFLYQALSDSSAGLLAAGYALVVFVLADRHRGHWLAARLAATGRLSLTNYVVQSLVAAGLILLGAYGRFGFWPLFAIAALVYAAEVAWSAPLLRWTGRGVLERVVRS